MRQRLIEGGADETGERAITFVVEHREVAIDFLTIEAGVLVSFPRVDSEAAGGQPEGIHGLAYCRIRDAVMSSQLNNRTRSQNVYEPEAEGHVLCPS
jgi:hypothetical protein